MRLHSPEKRIIRKLITFALSEIERKYGTGQNDGLIPKKYHHRIHSEETLKAVKAIAKLALATGKINKRESLLVEIAAGFHDIAQDLGSGLNEEESAKIASEEMRKTNIFTEKEVDSVRKMILGTAVYFENGIMRQSSRNGFLSQIMADADLSNLGETPAVYWKKSLRLLNEFYDGKPGIDNETAFTERQLLLLENHRYYTKEARKLFPYENKNIIFTRQHLMHLKKQLLNR